MRGAPKGFFKKPPSVINWPVPFRLFSFIQDDKLACPFSFFSFIFSFIQDDKLACPFSFIQEKRERARLRGIGEPLNYMVTGQAMVWPVWPVIIFNEP